MSKQSFASILRDNESHVDILLLLLAPVVLFLINDSWTFVAPMSWVDPFIYTGYFLDLRGHLETFPDFYYGSRLPWLLFGNAVFAALDTEAGNLFLRLFLLYSGIFCVYGIVRALWQDRLAATLTALLLGTNTAFLWSISWDYVDGPGIVSILFTLLFVTLATQSRLWILFMLAAGFMALITLSINLALGLVIPLMASWFIALAWLQDRRRIIPGLTFMALAALVAFVFFGVINVHLGGAFNYLQPQIDAARTNDSSIYGSPPLRAAGWLVFPFVGAIASIILVSVVALESLRTRSWPSKMKSFGVVAAAHLFSMLALWGAMQFMGSPVLLFAYYANFLLPFTFIALGGLLAIAISKTAWRPGWQVILLTCAFVALVLPFALGALRFLPSCPETCLSAQLTDVWTVLVASLFIVALLQRDAQIALAGIVAMAVLNVGVADTRVFYFDSDRRNMMENRALLRFDADERLKPFDQDSKLYHWYDYLDPYGPVYAEVASLHMWNARLVGYEFPKHRPVIAGQRIVVSSSQDDYVVLDRANEALAPDQLHVELDGQTRVERGADVFKQYFVTVAPGARLPSEKDYRVVAPLPIDDFLPVLGEVQRSPDGIWITTRPTPYAYGAVMVLPSDLIAQYSGAQTSIGMTIDIQQGPVEIGILSKNGRIFVAHEVLADPVLGLKLTLIVGDLSNASQVVIRTWDKGFGVVHIRDANLLVRNENPDKGVRSILAVDSFVRVAGEVQTSPERTRIETSTQQYAYAGVLSIPVLGLPRTGARSGRVLIALDVLRAPVEIGIASKDGKSFVVRELLTEAGLGVKIVLKIPDLANTSQLVIRNWDGQTRGLVEVTAVSITIDKN